MADIHKSKEIDGFWKSAIKKFERVIMRKILYSKADILKKDEARERRIVEEKVLVT